MAKPTRPALCANAGVAVVLVPGLPKTGLGGATRWLNPGKALIQLSLRYKSNDHLWFTFFHEAAHILLHGKKELFLEGLDGIDEIKEHEANVFARDRLIPPREFAGFCARQTFRKKLLPDLPNLLVLGLGLSSAGCSMRAGCHTLIAMR